MITSKEARQATLQRAKQESSAVAIQARIRGIQSRTKKSKKALVDTLETANNEEDDEEAPLDPEENILEKSVEQELTKQVSRLDQVHTEKWPAAFSTGLKAYPELTDNREVEEWICRNKKILMHLVTWNLCANPPPPVESALTKLFRRNRYHIVFVGSEECERTIARSAVNTSKKNWEVYLQSVLGPRYVPIRAHTLQAIHLICFAHEAVAHFIQDIRSAAVATGVGNTLGNKGGVGVYFKLGRTSFLVTNAHLAAHQNAVKQRNANFALIDSSMPDLLGKSGALLASCSANEKSNVQSCDDSQSETQLKFHGQLGESVPAESKIVADKTGTVGKQCNDTSASVAINREESNVLIAMNSFQSSSSLQQHDSREAKDGVSLNSDAGSKNVVSGGVENKPTELNPLEKKLECVAQNKQQEPQDKNFRNSVGGVDGLNQKPRKLFECADRVVFMGDLNYRIRGNRAAIVSLLEKGMIEVMLSNDQLIWSMKKRFVLDGFKEPPLYFKPTYKFDANSDVYDTSGKKRAPAWTDRILYVDRGLECLTYDADFSLRTSDHRPVFGTFLVDVDIDVHPEHLEKKVPQYSAESQVCGIM